MTGPCLRAAVLLAGLPLVLRAYVGPGAGFAFLGSFLALAASLLFGAFSLLTWPARIARRAWLRRRVSGKSWVKKLIFLGLDGLDPNVAERLMAEGKLPNLARLAREGTYRRLRTTCPALSPVAWSTFATGVNPAKHNIFDFLNRSLRTYAPELAGSRVGPPPRVWHWRRWRIPLSRPRLEFHRKSRAFWSILGDHAIRSTILRVPITFPPESFDGRLLSAMSTPDLRGTQGSFTFFTTRERSGEGVQPLRRDAGLLRGELEGPEDVFLRGGAVVRIPFTIRLKDGNAMLAIGGESVPLCPGVYTPWIPLRFRTAAGVAIRGLARFLLTEAGPDVSLYVTPVQIDPEHPALPISHPGVYATYLAKLLGPFATAGMAEDTWALNEGAIGETAFLDQAWQIFAERERMFLHTLARTRSGVAACVFDTSDRIQHMFHRQARDGGGNGGVIEDLYQRMDELVGKTMAFADSGTALFVLSDHGFCSFRRGVNLNSWLADTGYLARAEGGGIDWSRTRAYAIGLSGVYLNVAGREASGIVHPGEEARSLLDELAAALVQIRDPANGEQAVRRVYIARDTFQGPYLEAAPDLIVGWADGYRTSWDAAVGKIASEVFEDNTKPWSGDHCVDPSLVPGVLFSNLRLDAPDPGIEDMAPTALRLFGIEVPTWMDGKALAFSGPRA